MMSTPALDRKLLAILAADMVGYSKAMEADEAGTIKRLKAIRADLINPAISQRHGTVIKLMGDGALVVFDSVVDAVACAASFKIPWRRATPTYRSLSASYSASGSIWAMWRWWMAMCMGMG
ncbi:hypothetical protein AJ87_05080 [Rhizobium yanglingense]|nr:hypothetical protein AJ87_05080 [Rhizobium yanglingense]